MIAELQDLYRERTNFSTGVSRQSFTVSGGAALVYPSREFELNPLLLWMPGTERLGHCTAKAP